jgi:hypothetical protein
MEDLMTTLQSVAVDHLRMLQLERNPEQDVLYVRLAFTYGVEIPDIAHASGLPIERVRSILGGS